MSQRTLNEIDSLRKVLETAEDSSRVDVLNTLAVLYYNIDMKESLSLGQEALEEAKLLTYYKGTQDAHNILSRVHRRMGNYSKAIEYTCSRSWPSLCRTGKTPARIDYP
jgi:hypothetical protein